MDKDRSYIKSESNLNPRKSLLPYGIDNSAEIEKIKDLNQDQKFDFLFRICMVGDASVGKTSLLMRYCDNAFKKLYASTIGVDFRIISVKYNKKYIKLNIWDTAGQERFKSISANYFRKAHGFFFVYDVGNKDSFCNLKEWIEQTKSSNSHQCINFLVGNKSDLDEKERKVDVNEGLNIAKLNGMGFFETSAKNNVNVDNAFSLITKQLVEYFTTNKSIYDEIDLGNKLSDKDNGEDKDYVEVNVDVTKKSCKC